MNKEQLNQILEDHLKWFNDKGGSRADLRGANLHRADLHRADLRGANLHRADLHRADLRGANLYGANLHRADLYEADLYEADLRGADLYEANLRGVDLYGYVYIKGSLFDLQYLQGVLRIGCEVYSLEYWLIMYDTIGKENDFTDAQIKEYKNYMDMLKIMRYNHE